MQHLGMRFVPCVSCWIILYHLGPLGTVASHFVCLFILGQSWTTVGQCLVLGGILPLESLAKQATQQLERPEIYRKRSA